MKTIKNPVTGKEYKVKEHSSKYDPNKKIEGLWSTKMRKRKQLYDPITKQTLPRRG